MKVVKISLKFEDGTVAELIAPEKVFSSGRLGYFAQIPATAAEGNVYGGQIQIWQKTPK